MPPLVEPFIISGGTMNERRSLVVVLHDGEGHRGYGEAPPFELPFYSEEILVGARHLLEHVLIPRLVGGDIQGFEEVDRLIRTGVRGNPFARAALDTAAWDLEAARRGMGGRVARGTDGRDRRGRPPVLCGPRDPGGPFAGHAQALDRGSGHPGGIAG